MGFNVNVKIIQVTAEVCACAVTKDLWTNFQ